MGEFAPGFHGPALHGAPSKLLLLHWSTGVLVPEGLQSDRLLSPKYHELWERVVDGSRDVLGVLLLSEVAEAGRDGVAHEDD